jgi:hypothetical protein
MTGQAGGAEQEHGGEHQQPGRQDGPAVGEIVDDVDELDERGEHHQHGEGPVGPRSQRGQQHQRQGEVAREGVVRVDGDGPVTDVSAPVSSVGSSSAITAPRAVSSAPRITTTTTHHGVRLRRSRVGAASGGDVLVIVVAVDEISAELFGGLVDTAAAHAQRYTDAELMAIADFLAHHHRATIRTLLAGHPTRTASPGSRGGVSPRSADDLEDPPVESRSGN